MRENVQTPPEPQPSMAALVGGIINDAQQLIRQEVTLARRELQQQWDKTKTAVTSLAAGGAVAFLGGILLCFMLVHLIHWLSMKGGPGAADPSTIPLWACYGLVGLLFAIGGGALIYPGAAKASQVQIPPPQTVESLKEIV